MRTSAALLCLALSAHTAVAAEESWRLTLDRWGNPHHATLTITRDGAALQGTLDRDRVSGDVHGERVRFTATTADGASCRYDGHRDGDRLRGEADCPDTNHEDRRVTHRFTARRVPSRLWKTL